jgi:hypothetical protein
MREAAIRFLSSQEKMERVIEVCGWVIFLLGVTGTTMAGVMVGVLLWPDFLAFFAG